MKQIASKMKTQSNDIATLAIVNTGTENTVITYKSLPPLSFPTNDNGGVALIDASFLTGIKARDGKVSMVGAVKLQHIKACLKIAGLEDNDNNRAWFNREVRDPYHKALKQIQRVLNREGTPVSVGLSMRTYKKTGQKILTGKVGYEIEVSPAKEDPAKAKEAKAKKNAVKRAKRAAKKGLSSVGDAIAKVEKTVNVPANVETPATDKVSA